MTSNLSDASQYGAIFFSHELNSIINGGRLYGEHTVNQCRNFTGDYMQSDDCQRYKGIGYVISYNFTALHVSVCIGKVSGYNIAVLSYISKLTLFPLLFFFFPPASLPSSSR